MYHAAANQMKAGITILISIKVDIKAKSIARNTENTLKQFLKWFNSPGI